jgi:hypothetical protein
MMTFVEKVEKALEIGLIKNTFDNYELLSSEVKSQFVVEDIDNVILTSKKIINLINNDKTLFNKEISDLIEIIN